MSKTIEERLNQLEQAHGRLFNQVKHLIDEYNKKNAGSDLVIDCIKSRINNLENLIQLIEQDEYLLYMDNQRYTGQIKEIVSSKITEWRGKQFFDAEIKIDNRKEIYKIFVTIKNQPNINDKISFTYREEDNTLTQIRYI